MPGKDKTGPDRQGPATGRGRGNCTTGDVTENGQAGFSYREEFGSPMQAGDFMRGSGRGRGQGRGRGRGACRRLRFFAQ